jgi:hypothetical protein
MPLMETSITNQRPYWLQFLFAGQAYNISHRFSVADGATANHQLKTGANVTHVISSFIAWQGNNVGPVVFDMLENPTTITNGTLLPDAFSNLDRRSAKTSSVSYFTNPTAITGGTLIDRVAVYGGDSKVSSLPSKAVFETLLKASEDYVVRFTNNTGGTADIYVNIQFYESGN